MAVFFQNNMFLVFFIYGLSFFGMGSTIFLMTRRRTPDEFSKHLYSLALFGLIHGACEWLDMYKNVAGKGFSTTFMMVYTIFQLTLNVTSFVFLLNFGASITKLKFKRLPLLMLAIWLVAFIGGIIGFGTYSKWSVFGDTTARYLLALIGSILTSIGLFKVTTEYKEKYDESVLLALKVAGVVFAFYGLFGGAIVQKGDYLLAGILNYPNFQKVFGGIPVQAFRGLTALIAMFAILKVLDIFEINIQSTYEEKIAAKEALTELIKDVNHNTKGLVDTLENFSDSIKESEKSAGKISVTVSAIVTDTNKQNKQIEMITGKANEVSNNVSEIAVNTKKLAEVWSGASETAVNGTKSIKTAIEHMQSIEATETELSETITSLSSLYVEINQFVDVIQGIAKQTNLLSLNAAIEAARAGETGRGFAVVAGEVGKLADESAKATERITRLVQQIQEKTESAALATKQEIDTVNTGKQLFQEAGYAFTKITDAFSDTNHEINNICDKSKKVSTVIDLILDSLNQTVEMAKDNSDTITTLAKSQVDFVNDVGGLTSKVSKMAETLKDSTQIAL